MKHELDLNRMGLTPLTEIEMQETDGGKFANWLKWIGAAVAVIGIAIGSVCFLAGCAMLAMSITYGADGVTACVEGPQVDGTTA